MTTTEPLDEALFERVQASRLPLQGSGQPARADAAEPDWKDWWHVVLLDLESHWRVLLNLSLTGGPQAEAQFTLIVHEPRPPGPARLHGHCVSVPLSACSARRSPWRLETPDAMLALVPDGFTLTARPRHAALSLELRLQVQSTPLMVTEASPFGSGFIGWGLVPRLAAEGVLRVDAREQAVGAGWVAYQDHNFGRFRWGEDFGWEWLVAQVRGEDGREATVVVDRRTDALHRRAGLPYLFLLERGRLRKVFLGPALRLRWVWSSGSSVPTRMPGALACLLVDRPCREPVRLQVEAADEQDRLRLSLRFDSHCEVIAPDNQAPQFSRIGECSGAAQLDWTGPHEAWSAQGQAYAEFTR